MNYIGTKILQFLLPVLTFCSIGAIAQTAAPADKNDPNIWHTEGIYYYNKSNPGNTLVMIDASVASESKEGGYGHHLAHGLSGGLTKEKEDARIAGATSNTVVKETRPSFYCYFSNATTTPKLFSLCKFFTKKHERILTMGTSNAFGHTTGISEKQIVEFSYERIADGIFKVTPKEDLKEGEYCFYYIGKNESPFANGFYDFGITTP